MFINLFRINKRREKVLSVGPPDTTSVILLHKEMVLMLNPTPVDPALVDETTVVNSQTPTTPVGFGFQFSLFLANVVSWLLFYPLTTILYPQQVTNIDASHKEVLLSVALTIGSVVGLGLVPLVGVLSDRTRSPLGRRRPWILFASVVSIVGFLVLAQATSPIFFTIGTVIVGIASGTLSTASNAILPDHVPEQQRGTVSGWVGLATPVSLVITALFVPRVLARTGGSLSLAYYLLIIPVVAVLVPYALFLRDTALPPTKTSTHYREASSPRFSLGFRLYSNFGFVCITRFLLILGFNIGTAYLFFYLHDVVRYEQLFPGHTAAEGVASLQLISVAGLIVATIFGGIISDRIHNRKLVVMVSSALIGVGLLTLAIAHIWTAAIIGSVFLGLGFGAYLAVDAALATLVLPHQEHRARDLAFVAVSGNIGILIAPIIAAIVITSFGLAKAQAYTLLFIIAGILAILAAILIQPIKGIR
jgi:MFS family permease